jgi:hypothetical protein
MSEVVPLPSFGEVFFDARGQDRVLRVTWHEGTLVLSLWRGEMCTGSFRMLMDDVGRLIDGLDDGYAEAGGQYADDGQDPGTGPIPRQDAVHPGQPGYPGQPDYAGPPSDYPAPQAEYPDYPGTGQYSRPAPDQYGGPSGPQPPMGSNDVLVARGAPPREAPREVPRDRPFAPGPYEEPPRQYGAPPPGHQGQPVHPGHPGQPVAGHPGQPVHPGRPAGHPGQQGQPVHPGQPVAGHPGQAGYQYDTGPQDPVYPQQPQGRVDPSDPLGLGQGRPYPQEYGQDYPQEPMYATGERLRPDQRPDDPRDDQRVW